MSPLLPRQPSSGGTAGPDCLDAGFVPSFDGSTTQHPLSSPCFIHSRLDSVLESSRKENNYFDPQDRSAIPPAQHGSSSSSADNYGATQPAPNVRNVFSKNRPEPRHRGAQGAVEPESGSEGEDGSDASTSRNGSSTSFSHSSSEDSEDDSDRVRSLTRQLAETAVGVREMSKQLGRARVKSTIQSVLIITKARDNHLIKLTRELAIWLMNTPRNGKDTGLTVYVDSQLRQSKRFDAEGIKQEFPHLFALGGSRQQSFGADVDDDRPPSEPGSLASSRAGSFSHSRDESQLRYWTSDMCSRSPHLFDFVVTLGGDGTVLFCSWLFQRIVPPVMPFALGSLGFLTNFDYSDYKKVLKSALDTGIRVNLRMRFTATVYRATLPSSTSADRKKRRAIRSGKTGEIIMRNIQEGGWDRIETPLPSHGDLRGTFTESEDADNAQGDRPASRTIDQTDPANADRSDDGSRKKDKEVMCFSTRPVETFEVLNDLVVDRGPSPYVSLLEVFGDEHHMTTAQADGLCISTPTGSTAYSLSAGGSLVHPEIPAILITPICPHTLSFRPMLLPDSMELRIAVPYNSRSTAWASFDGRGRVELKQGDHIKVTASRYPFPTVCAENQSTDWFESISRTLKWNERQRQKSFVVVEEGEEEQEEVEAKGKISAGNKIQEASSTQKKAKAQVSFAKKASDRDDDEDVDDDDEQEEEEAFDIDDTSTAATRASSPDGVRQSSQHHHQHHHHRRNSSNKVRSRNGSSSGSLTSSLAGSSNFLQNLHPLTTVRGSGGSANDDGRGSPVGGPGFGRAQFVGQKDDILFADAKEDGEASRMKNYQHGVVQPSNRSLLDSPDRFGLAGPPQPPRAISERHLASADFRLDGGKAEDDGENERRLPVDQKAETATIDEKRKDRIQPSSLTNPRAAKASDALREEIQAPLLEPGGPSKKASKLYKKLRGKAKSHRSNSQDSRGNGGDTLDLTKSSSRGTGTALVVYGQDESDSDSTAEG